MSQTSEEDSRSDSCRRQQALSCLSLGASILALICTFSMYVQQPTQSDLRALRRRVAEVEELSSVTRQGVFTRMLHAPPEPQTDTSGSESSVRLRRDAKEGAPRSTRRSRSATAGKKRRKSPAESIVGLESVEFEAKLPTCNLSSLAATGRITMPSVDGYITEAGFHPNAEKYRFWSKVGDEEPPSFVHESRSPDWAEVTVVKDGMYFVYAQVLYHDLSGRWAFGIYVDDTAAARCITSQRLEADYLSSLPEAHKESHGVYTHCGTSRAVHVRRNQRLSIRSLYPDRVVVAQPQSTFWGIIKM